MTLHVWHNGYDWVVADGVDDARAVLAEAYGTTGDPSDNDGDGWSELPDDLVFGIWTDPDAGPTPPPCGCRERCRDHERRVRLHDQELIEYRHLMNVAGVDPRATVKACAPHAPKDSCGPNGHYSDCQVGRPRKTCAQWVVDNGRGILCSTEY